MWRAAAWGSLIALLVTVGCECGPEIVITCADAIDCVDHEWSNPHCDEAQGHWECITVPNGTSCESPCDVCTTAEACEYSAREWPGECDRLDGEWLCVDGSCVASCPQCLERADCEGTEWPAGAPCAEAEGTWACVDEACEPRCPGEQCIADDACTGLPWPDDGALDCEESGGHWECVDRTCAAMCNEQCNAVADCLWRDWVLECGGHFECRRGLCQGVCDAELCGDTVCDETMGETALSCPDDCVEPCGEVADCLEGDWAEICAGHWDCTAGGACVGVCDYAHCGDGTCDGSIGETLGSCAVDCRDACVSPSDCLEHRWDHVCHGHWICYGGSCMAICDDRNCGNGVCEPMLGEAASTCADCGRGYCDTEADCLGATWPGSCDGHWDCDPTGHACASVCDDAGCGDGTCDVLAGEGPSTCAHDCASYACETTPGCAGTPLPAGCEDGEWICYARVCRPVCP